jgi:hypothetical protein
VRGVKLEWRSATSDRPYCLRSVSRISSARGAPGIAQIQKRADFVQGEAQVAGLLDESERSPTNLIQDDTALAKRVGA